VLPQVQGVKTKRPTILLYFLFFSRTADDHYLFIFLFLVDINDTLRTIREENSKRRHNDRFR